MVLMTKRVKAATALAFYSPDGLIASLDTASRFAGADGRVATIADIVDARIAQPYSNTVWRTWYTTTSAEYFGLSNTGIPLIIVAHGNGPMQDKEGILKAYAHQYKDKTRRRYGGRIPMEIFRRLEDGAFGPVDIIPISQMLEVPYSYAFGARTAEEILNNPLWIARLGGWQRAEAYVEKHSTHADEERDREVMRFNLPAASTPSTILNMRDSNETPYLWETPQPNSLVAKRTINDDFSAGAVAHLLSIGEVYKVHRHPDIVPRVECDIGTQDWTDGAKFVGVRGVGEVTRILPQFDRDDTIKKRIDLLWIDDEGDSRSVSGFGPLIKIGNRWFSQYPKTGEAMDTGSAMHAVVSHELIGGPVMLKTSGRFFFKYGLDEARRIAPEGANAYHICGPVEQGDNEIIAPLQFSRVVVDRSRRLMTKKEVMADIGLLEKIAGL